MKKVFCLTFVIMLAAVLFTGCHSMSEGIEYQANIPEQTNIHFLIKSNSTDISSENQTEISEYREDGFICAEAGLPKSTLYSNRFIFAGSDSDRKTLIRYVKEYPDIRIAVTDDTGKILTVSPTFSLLIPDRNYFWSEINYDFEKNQITGVQTSTLDDTHFISLLKWTLFSFFSVVFMAILSGIPLIQKKLFPLLWIVCTLPILRMIFLQYEEFFTYFYRSDSFSNKTALIWISVCILPWICLSVSGWINFIKNKLYSK